jgi:pimeloyl-ACP methyl ester carboxylesterase
MNSVRTSVLEIAFEDDGPRDGAPLMLLHGWPDAPRGWNAVAQELQAAGYPTVIPYLRGLPPTRFLSEATPRLGAAVALAQDEPHAMQDNNSASPPRLRSIRA